MGRQFSASSATRKATPVLIGLSGPSGSGKTKSALRIATGMVRVSGGKIGYVDTEANRALHYAPQEGKPADLKHGTYDFVHIPFGAPFGPLDYLAALEFAVAQGCTVIVVDSMSHEHEGPGGVLEMHEAETQRLVQAWRSSPDAVKMAAWQKPKSERRRLINGLLQMPVSFIFCFRAKEKIRIPERGEVDQSGKKAKPSNLGYLPIAGEEFVFEQTANLLLLPGAQGRPEWEPEEAGEKALVKVPEYLVHCFPKGAQLSEETGECLARWSAGKDAQPPSQQKTQPSRAKTPAPAEVLSDIRRALAGDLKMEQKEAAAWVVKYAGTPLPELSATQASAILRLARAAYRSRMANDDDAQFAAEYEMLQKDGVIT